MRILFYIVSIFVMFLYLTSTMFSQKIELLSNEIVYESPIHAGFTSLLRFNDTTFLTFREGTVHNPKTKSDYGVIKIVKLVYDIPVDTMVIACDTADLRDPFLIEIDGILRIYSLFIQRKDKSEGDRYSGMMYADYKNGKWSELKKTIIESPIKYIIWKVRRLYDRYYSIGYNIKHGPALLYSNDGYRWYKKNILSDNGKFTEGDLVALDGDKWMGIVRNEDYFGAPSLLLTKDDITNDKIFDYSHIDRSIASPELLKVKDGMVLLGGREYDFIKDKSRPDSINVSLLLLTSDGTVLDRLVIPGNRLDDKGYPSFQSCGDTIFMSYYRALENNRYGIFLSKLKIED